jgi:general secretion pathway protein L
MIVDVSGAVVARGEAPIGVARPSEPLREILVVPGVEVSARWVHLPTRSQAQAMAAARLHLADQLALAEEDVHLAVGPLEDDGHRLVVVMARRLLQGWLADAALHGVFPDVVLPDHLMLPPPDEERLIGAFLGGLLAVRGRRTALTMEPDLASLVLQGRDVEMIEGPQAVEGALATSAADPAINLLQGEFDPRRESRLDWPNLKRASMLAGALALSIPILFGAQILRDHMAAVSLERQAARAAAAVLPKSQVIVDPAAETRTRLHELQLAAGGGPAALIATLFTALESIGDSQLEGLVLSPDGSVRARISYGQISDVELFREAMGSAGVVAREEATQEEGARIVSDVILGVRS